MDRARRILIVGGGTAGWLTAAYLARALDLDGRADLSITVVESPDVGTVGVGEGAFPTIRTTLQFLGIDEYEFIRATSATFKQGIRFDNWLHAPRADGVSQFLHPFEPPLYADETSLVAMWLAQNERTRPPFAEAVTIQHHVVAHRRGPKRVEEAGFAAPLSYAYHFDAAGLARLLADRAQSLGVTHVADRLLQVAIDGDGGIAHLEFERSGAMQADLYIDCTGLRSELIGGALGEPFVSVRKYLFTDRALACRAPHRPAHDPLPSYTIAAAHGAGWMWDIGLRDLRGIGNVYSSAHMDDAAARAALGAYLDAPDVAESARLIRFEPGYRKRQWVRNCVAVGMSGGFLEPLESTGIVLIEVAAAMIAELFPHNGPIDAAADRFNALMAARYDAIVNFLKLHYCLSHREEPFWRDNVDPSSIPDSLRALLDQWRFRPPSRFDFMIDVETFAFFNYQYILYGMGFTTQPAPGRIDGAPEMFERIRKFGSQAVGELPEHHLLIDDINRV